MFYDYLAGRYGDPDWAFMNLGFAQLDANAPRLSLRASDEADRLCIQLYHQVIEPVNLRGLAVLEVSCGRGGGLSYIGRYVHPRVIVGMDFSHRALAHAAKRRTRAGFSLCQGDADALPFASNTFDAVVNIEALHCYKSVPRFLSEACRVLRQGGHLLLADVCDESSVALLKDQLGRAGFTVPREKFMGPNVLAAMHLDSDRKSALIRRHVPRLLHRSLQQFAGVKGSRLYATLRLGRSEYISYTLQKVRQESATIGGPR